MSAAGLWSTPQDLAKFLIELQLALLNQSNRVLTGNTVEEMIAPFGDLTSTTSEPFYGLGFMLSKIGDEVIFGHAGNQTGFHSQMQATKSGAGYVVMTNGDYGPEVIAEIASLIKRDFLQGSF
nr:serine hydrolase [Gammaproteobacteria bacterium]